jgi:hypothetical protein
MLMIVKLMKTFLKIYDDVHTNANNSEDTSAEGQ